MRSPRAPRATWTAKRASACAKQAPTSRRNRSGSAYESSHRRGWSTAIGAWECRCAAIAGRSIASGCDDSVETRSRRSRRAAEGAEQCGAARGAPTCRRRDRALGDGPYPLLTHRRHRVSALSMVDLCTRDCVGLAPVMRLGADDMVVTLSRQSDERGIPTVIKCDNGTEFTSVALDHRCFSNQVRVDFSRPG